jgi:hypothetical protein
MQTLKTVCKFVRTYQDLIDYFYNSQYEVKNLLFPTDDTAMILYKDMHWGSNQANLVIAAFVTAQARLKLFNEMLILGERVLYDTDSIIYKRSLDLFTPKLGVFLGEFTNEIDPNEGNDIVEFVAAGPKNFSYKLDTGITHLKVKGFSLNFASSKMIDFLREENINIYQSTIVRN